MISKTPSQEEVIEYVYAQFCLSYVSPELSVEQLKELCLLSADVKGSLNLPSLWKPNTFFLYKDYSIPVFFEENITAGTLVNGVVQMDVYLNAFLFLSGIQEWAFEERDKHGRFLYKNSLQAKSNFVGTPVVNVYFELLAKAIREKGHDCHHKQTEKELVFTHDIDQVRSGWFEDIIYALKNVGWRSPGLIVKSMFTKVFGTEDPYYKAILRMNELDAQYKLDSISFLMTKKSHKDGDYDINKLFKTGVFDKQTTGLHPGYDTYKDKNELAKQFETLKRLFPNCKRIVRQHFLRYEIRVTPQIHESLGIERDYSLGFVEQHGFRNSYSGPFQLYNFEDNRPYSVIQIPLYFMDSTLTNYLKKDSWEAKLEVVQTVEKLLKTFNCTFSVLFHNSVFTENKYKGFEKMYIALAKISNQKTD
jgi:hypothetical protein